MDNRTCLDADHDQTKKEVAGLKVADLAKPRESMESIQKEQDKKNDEMMKSTEALKQQLATLKQKTNRWRKQAASPKVIENRNHLA